MFVSGNIRHDIISAKLHDTGANVSDHIDIDRVAYTVTWALLLKSNHSVLRNITHGDGTSQL